MEALSLSESSLFSSSETLWPDVSPNWLSYSSSEPLWLDVLQAFCSESSIRATRARRSLSFAPAINVKANFDLTITAVTFALVYFQSVCPNLASQPNGPGIQPYFPLQERFQEPRSEAHCQAQKLVQSRATWALAPFLPFAHFAFFPLIVFSPVLNSIDHGLWSIVFVISKDLFSFILSYGALGPLGPSPSFGLSSGLSSVLSSSLYSASYFC